LASLSTLPCGLSWPHKWKFIVSLTPSRIKCAPFLNKRLELQGG
jgi:hypothetical protein